MGKSMKCRELIAVLEELAPEALAESWDNVGLLAGRFEKEITTVLIAVDASSPVVEEAIRRGADLLLTHHPLIFSGCKRVNDGDFIGRRLVSLLRHDICCYAMHTNFDIRGMADAAADRFDLRERQALLPAGEADGKAEGIGRFGTLPKTMTLRECAESVKEAFGLESVRIFGDGEKSLTRAAICPGSGRSALGRALELKADVLITGDIDHHTGIDAMEQGLSILDAGHYGLEKLFAPYMESWLKERCRELTVLRAAQSSPFWTV